MRTLLLMFNADHEQEIPFTLPEVNEGRHWQRMLDTAAVDADESDFQPATQYALQPASLAMFRLRSHDGPE